MRLVPLPLALTAAIAACSSLPPPPNQDRGAVAYDRSTRTLWLNGRETYHVPPSVNTVGLRLARTAVVTWEQRGDRREVVRYSVEEYRDFPGLGPD